MAAKSKKKGSTRKTTKNKKQTKVQEKEQSFITDEVVIWLTLAVSILLLLSNFGLGGTIGGAVSGFLKMVFGIVAYVVPFVLFGIVAFLVSNKENAKAYIRSVVLLIFVILTCLFFHLIKEYGGVIGKGIAGVLTPAIGVAGTYVVDIICMIICLVILTGKSALKGVTSQGNKAYSKARDDAKRHREAAIERKRERKNERARVQENRPNSRLRKDKHVSGVSFDTTISKKSPDIKEVSVDAKEDHIARTSEPDAAEKKIPDFVISRNEPVAAPEVSDNVLEAESEPVEEPVKTRKRRTTKQDHADTLEETADVAATIAENDAKPKSLYETPPIHLLKKGKRSTGESDASLRETALKLQQILDNFGVKATVTNVSCGPSVTRYELQPEMGVKVSKIVGLADDIKLNLAAADIRIEAPIPGKAAVGIEVPNKENSVVMLRDLIESTEFANSKSKISFAVGKDIGGKVVVTDLAKMPHVLIAGATGSGKSVCINTLIMSILYKAHPDEVKLIMIDPKVVELSVYNGIPHLMIPVVTDPKKAAGALNWAVAEMDRRYREFAAHGVRDMKGYNKKIESEPPIDGVKLPRMPQIVIIVDELADLMMVASGDVEGAICRLAQLARAAGIHLVVATQRPSVNVITGLIKANMPSRIAFAVSSGVDSRTIIDMNGAEKLLGKGDMLFYPSGYPKPARVQGSFVTDEEVQNVVDYLMKHNETIDYDEEIVNQVNTSEVNMATSISASDDDDRDTYFVDAGRLIIDKEKASIGMLQRSFKIGFNRAARIMDQLCEAGVVGGEEGTKPRKVLMSSEEFEQFVENL